MSAQGHNAVLKSIQWRLAIAFVFFLYLQLLPDYSERSGGSIDSSDSSLAAHALCSKI